MAEIDPISTPRLWVDYNDGVHDHSIMFRYVGTAGVVAAMGVAHNFLQALDGSLYTISIIAARTAIADSPVSFPVTWDGDPTYGTGTLPPASAPLELCFVGRTLNGRMAKWFMFGVNVAVPDSYRYFPGDNTNLDAAVAAIRAGVSAGTIIAIDGVQPNVYPYINIQFNSYWESQARR